MSGKSTTEHTQTHTLTRTASRLENQKSQLFTRRHKLVDVKKIDDQDKSACTMKDDYRLHILFCTLKTLETERKLYLSVAVLPLHVFLGMMNDDLRLPVL